MTCWPILRGKQQRCRLRRSHDDIRTRVGRARCGGHDGSGACAMTSVERPRIPRALQQSRVVAILRRTYPRAAVGVAEALVRGGVTALEVTCDSPSAMDMIRAI